MFSRRKWCCKNLKDAFEARDRRGICVLAELSESRIDVGATFWIGMRSIDVSDSMPEPADGGDVTPVLIETRHRIFFCPWCGCRLERFYRKIYEQLYDADASERCGPAAVDE